MIRNVFGRPDHRLALASLAILVVAAGPVRAAPDVLSTSPAGEEIGVVLDHTISVGFTEPLDPSTVLEQNVRVHTSLRGRIDGTLQWHASGDSLSFDPDDDFLPGERVTVQLTKGLRNLNAEPLPRGFQYQFTTWTAPVAVGGFVASAGSWPIGAVAFNLTVADLTGDGLPEAIFSNVVPDSLTILSPDGFGGFFLLSQLPTGILPRHTVVTDVNADGEPDLVCCASGPNAVDVFLNQGEGQFAAGASYPAGQTPYGAFAGDLDADGDVDVVTANFNGHDISILENQGDGTFALPVDVPASPGADSPRWVDGADFDGDGDIDLAACNGYSYDVTVFLNQGDGTFDAQSARNPVEPSPNFLEARDFNGDGIVDLVTVNAGPGSISFLAGNGDGTFGKALHYPVGGTLPYGLQVADLDGDLDLDVVVPIRGTNVWRVMINDGNGVFTGGTEYGGGTHCHTVGVADWDGDGDLDVVSGFAISRNMFLYEHQAAPAVLTTSPSVNETGVPLAQPIALTFNTELSPGSLTADGFQVSGDQSGPHDLTITWSGSTNEVLLTPSGAFVPGEIVSVTVTGDGVVTSMGGVPHPGYSFGFMTEGAVSDLAFQHVSVSLPGSDPVDLAASDLDGDGRSDLIVLNFLSGDATLALTGGSFPQVTTTVPVGVGPIDLVTADFDGDTHIDVVVANATSQSITLLTNSGDGTLVASTVATVSGTPFALAGGDFDVDGDPDLALAMVDPDGLCVLWNAGDGSFPVADVLPVSGTPLELARADLDRDGDLDLISVQPAQNRIEIFHSEATGFVSRGTFTTGSVPVEVFPWDTNGDGWIDLVSADYGAGGISVLESLGDGFSFAPAFSLPSSDLPHAIWGADLTGDGELELVTANSGASNLMVFRNLGGGAFDGGTSLPAGQTPYAVVGGDWNGDGSVDLAAVNRTGGNLSLLFNGASTSVLPADSAPASGLLGVRPNPFRDFVSVQLSLARPSRVELRLFDLQGRSVATLHDGNLSSGVHRVTWNGRSRSGTRVAAGVYFLRMDADGRGWTRKIIRLR